jgi:pseudouridine kinase
VGEGKVLVVGASNVDIKGRSISAVYSRMKNPGTIKISAGGVGRNIAENLSRLGVKTQLLTAVGQKEFSRIILDETEKAGVDTSRIYLAEEEHSGIFMAVINSRGDLESSISDMSILSFITPEYILSHKDAFDEVQYVVLDADIPEETLELCIKLSKERNIPVCVEPVSPAKAQVMLPYLKDISLTTPNREEVEVLVGRSLQSSEDIKTAGAELLNKGLQYVIITLGPEGVYCTSREFSGFISSVSTVVVDSVGAGDALVGGVVTGFLKGLSFLEAVKWGVAAATLTLRTSQAVSPDISLATIEEIMGRIQTGT